MSSDTHYSNYLISAIQQKLRQSCNRCSAQKIRCSKERPTCARCASKNLPCNYSLSQRTGRRTSINPGAQMFINEATTPAVETTSSEVNPTDRGTSLTITTTNAQNPVTSADMADSMSTIFMGDLGFETTDGFNVSQREVDMQTEVPTISPESPIMLHRTSHSNGFPQMTTPNISTYFAEPSLGIEDVTPHVQGQDCMALALELIQSMHVLSSTCALSVAANPAPHSPTGPDNWGTRKETRAARGMDIVLIKNRAAIKTLHRIMQCSCSQDRSMAFICSMVVEKILRWYRAGTRDFEGDDGTTGEREGLPEQVMSLPIYMGEYRLYSVSQRTMRASLVLDELKTQMKPLVEKFTKRFCPFPQDSGSQNKTSLISSCYDLDKHLRERLRDVAKEAGESDII